MTTPGHGLTFVKKDQLDSAVASAALAHLGKHAPMIVLAGKELSKAVEQYLRSIQPKYETEPTEVPYNHAYLIGSEKSVPFNVQGKIDHLMEIVPRDGGNGHGGHMNNHGTHGAHMDH